MFVRFKIYSRRKSLPGIFFVFKPHGADRVIILVFDVLQISRVSFWTIDRMAYEVNQIKFLGVDVLQTKKLIDSGALARRSAKHDTFAVV